MSMPAMLFLACLSALNLALWAWIYSPSSPSLEGPLVHLVRLLLWGGWLAAILGAFLGFVSPRDRRKWMFMTLFAATFVVHLLAYIRAMFLIGRMFGD